MFQNRSELQNGNVLLLTWSPVSQNIKSYCMYTNVFTLIFNFHIFWEVPSWSWSHNSWMYNYLCSQCLSPLTLCVWLLFRQGVLYATLCDKVCQWPATGLWFSLGAPVPSTNKTDRHDITEILLKVVLNTINQTIYVE